MAVMAICHEPYCLGTKDMPSLVFCQNIPDNADKKNGLILSREQQELRLFGSVLFVVGAAQSQEI